MTVNQLHKILGKLVQQGEGRTVVRVAKKTFTHNCESDGCTILDIDGYVVQMIPNSDDDGGLKENKDGSESLRRTVVLHGQSHTRGAML